MTIYYEWLKESRTSENKIQRPTRKVEHIIPRQRKQTKWEHRWIQTNEITRQRYIWGGVFGEVYVKQIGCGHEGVGGWLTYLETLWLTYKGMHYTYVVTPSKYY